MQSLTISKYLFRIRTRNGVVVEHLSVSGRDEAEARRKIAQIYNGCAVLACEHREIVLHARHGAMSFEDVADLISSS